MLHDQILHTLRTKSYDKIVPDHFLPTSKNVIDLFAKKEKQYHTFFFNNVEPDKDLTETGYEFMKKGLMKPPFDNCIYQYKYRDIEGCLFITKENSITLGMENTSNTYMLMEFMKSGDDFGSLPVCIGYNNSSTDDLMNAVKLTEQDNLGQKISDEDYSLICEQSLGMLYQFTMLINMKSVAKETIPEKKFISQQRLKKGKYPFSSYILIDGKQFALQSKETGSHASPIPHFRRGHIRHWGDRMIPIDPVIVNAHMGVPVIKDYIVK